MEARAFLTTSPCGGWDSISVEIEWTVSIKALPAGLSNPSSASLKPALATSNGSRASTRPSSAFASAIIVLRVRNRREAYR